MRPPVNHAVGALVDAVQLLIAVHAAALIQHAHLRQSPGRGGAWGGARQRIKARARTSSLRCALTRVHFGRAPQHLSSCVPTRPVTAGSAESFIPGKARAAGQQRGEAHHALEGLQVLFAVLEPLASTCPFLFLIRQRRQRRLVPAAPGRAASSRRSLLLHCWLCSRRGGAGRPAVGDWLGWQAGAECSAGQYGRAQWP